MSTAVSSAEEVHTHDHDHDHEHSTLGEMDVRVRALETLLTQKGYLDPAAVDRIIETYEVHVGPHNGAKVVARAWCEAEIQRDAGFVDPSDARCRTVADDVRVAMAVIRFAGSH